MTLLKSSLITTLVLLPVLSFSEPVVAETDSVKEEPGFVHQGRSTEELAKVAQNPVASM